MDHIGTKKLTTERLVLRKFVKSDYEKVFANWTSNNNVAFYTSWNAHDSAEATQNYVLWLMERYKEKDFYCWGIEYKDELVGEVSVVEKIDHYGICGIGYALSEKVWGSGIMTEACSCVLTYLFKEIGYRKIIAGCDELNIGSIKVLENIGMTLEGIFRQHILRKDGTYGNSQVYGILSNEFLTN